MRVHPPRTSGRALVASFAAVAVAFTLGVAAAQIFAVRIRSAAHEITENSAPSISYLSSMRSTLRQLEVIVEEHVTACESARCGPRPARIDELREELQVTWQSYRLLPTFPGESARWPAVEASLSRLGETLALTFDAVDKGRWQDARARLGTEVTGAFDRVDGEIARIVESDHADGLALASRIDALARRLALVSFTLDLVAIALTALAAALGIRVVRRYERSLRDRADDLDQFAGRVAHDVKGPLAATAAALRVARRHSSEEGRTALDRGERGLLRVQRLVDGLLDFARAGGRHVREANAEVQEVVEDVLGELRPLAEDHRIELRLASITAGRVTCSPGVLTSVVANLVRNAIVHMGPGEPRIVRVRATSVAADRAVRIEVEDTGPGIPQALGETIFEPFVRGPAAQTPGAGLGLATVKRFVGAHGGRVGFEGRSGQGTIFWLEMPLLGTDPR